MTNAWTAWLLAVVTLLAGCMSTSLPSHDFRLETGGTVGLTYSVSYGLSGSNGAMSTGETFGRVPDNHTFRAAVFTATVQKDTDDFSPLTVHLYRGGTLVASGNAYREFGAVAVSG